MIEPPNKLTDITPELVKRSYLESGNSCQVAADRLGVSVTTVYRRLKLAGVAIRRPEFQPDRKLDAEAAQMYREGVSAPRIAKAFGCSSSWVYDALVREGVERRRRGKYSKAFLASSGLS